MKRSPVILFLLSTFFFLAGCSSSSPLQELGGYLEQLDSQDQFSGVVIIAKGGEPIFEGAYGLRNRADNLPNQLDTKFNLAAMDKMFTGVAIMQLAEQERLSVDDVINQHLAGYPNQEVASRVTIHQLLTHTAGLGDFYTLEYRETSKDQFKDHEDYLPLFAEDPLVFAPGTQPSYNNAGFIVLGMIIEEITGQSYFEYVNENIFQPCGMSETGSFEADRVVPNTAIGYSSELRPKYDLPTNFYVLPYKGTSAGGGYSTTKDLLRFSECLLNHQLLTPEITDILLEDKGSRPFPDTYYAYGYMFQYEADQRIVGHAGRSLGVCNGMGM